MALSADLVSAGEFRLDEAHRQPTSDGVLVGF
ncbi:hypothetical protein N181_20310 [Sinorhizobium fredii USDA 205]|nr:hypothetical protein N181_20310 [Sinorhizobium fredii USDA 205]